MFSKVTYYRGVNILWGEGLNKTLLQHSIKIQIYANVNILDPDQTPRNSASDLDPR